MKNNKQLMGVSELRELLDWFKKQDINSFGILGGEPTLHPDFNNLIGILSEYEMSVIFPTNGIFENKKREAFLMNVIRMVVVHVNSVDFYKNDQYQTLIDNVKFLSDIENISVEARFVIENDDIPVQQLLDFSKNTGVETIKFVFAKPEAHKKNSFLSLQEVKNLLPIVKEAVVRLRDNGLRSEIVGLLPFCVISGYEDVYFIKNTQKERALMCAENISQDFDTSIVINPDLTANVCSVLPITTMNRRVTEYGNLDEVKDDFEKRFIRIKEKPLFDECHECSDFGVTCQGGCLIYKDQD